MLFYRLEKNEKKINEKSKEIQTQLEGSDKFGLSYGSKLEHSRIVDDKYVYPTRGGSWILRGGTNSST